MESKDSVKKASEGTSEKALGNVSKSAAGRLRFVDIAKGISIICIILGHLGIHNITRVVFTFHVPIFFLITGYFVSRKEGVRDFAIKKARTLLVPYFVTSLVMIAVAAGLGLRDGGVLHNVKEWTYAALYASGGRYDKPFYIKEIGAIWFLWASFWGCLFLRAALELKARWRITMIAALFAFGYYSRALCWFPLSIQAGACAAAFMYLGHLFRVEEGVLRGLSMETRVFGTLAALGTWVMFIKDFQAFWLVNCDFGRGIVDIFGCICACYIVLLGAYFLDRWGQAGSAGVGSAGEAGSSAAADVRSAGSAGGAAGGSAVVDVGAAVGAAGGSAVAGGGIAARLAGGLAYIGKYSLLVLCIHIVELNFLPWIAFFQEHGMPAALQQPARIAGKLCLDLGGAYLLSKSRAVRKLFGYKK